MTAQMQVDQFNESHNIRSVVSYRNDKGKIVEAEVRHQAEVTENGIPIVWVTGSYNAINLNDLIK